MDIHRTKVSVLCVCACVCVHVCVCVCVVCLCARERERKPVHINQPSHPLFIVFFCLSLYLLSPVHTHTHTHTQTNRRSSLKRRVKRTIVILFAWCVSIAFQRVSVRMSGDCVCWYVHTHTHTHRQKHNERRPVT